MIQQHRYLPWIKGLCALLGLVILIQLGKAFGGANPLKGVSAPTPWDSSPPAKDSNSEAPPASIELQACLQHLERSGALGRTPGPAPLALFGFAGNSAMLSLPNGQTVMVAEGEERDGVKVLKIDTNRVLLMHEGQQMELTLFSGLGSESLKK